MSRTGSMLIVNQRHPNDYKKAIQTQDELLKIAIANDANIAKARKDFKNEEPVFLTLRQSMSPEELLQDESLQIQNAMSNLLDIGFRDIEARNIVSSMMPIPDLIYKFNLTAKAIKEDVKKRFDIKILTPAYFLEYLNRYIQELDESAGLQPVANANIKNKFDALTRNIRDILHTIPKHRDLEEVYRNINQLIRQASRDQRDHLNDVEQVLRSLIYNLPTEAELAALQGFTQVDKMEILQQIQNIADSLPDDNNLYALHQILINGQYTINQKIDEIDSILGNINTTLVQDLQEIKTRLRSGLVAYPPQRQAPIAIPLAVGYAGIPAPTLILQQPSQGYSSYGTTGEESGTSTPAETPRTPMGRGFHLLEKGSKWKSGIAKIGKGVALQEHPKHLQFGKYVIDKHRLDNQNVLHFKHKSLGATKFKPLSVSDDTKDVVNDLLGSGKINHKHFSKLPSSEQSYLYNVIQGAGLLESLKIKLPNDKEDENRFEILRGEYLAGNNSLQLIRELRMLIVKFMNEGKLTKRQGNELLVEII